MAARSDGHGRTRGEFCHFVVHAVAWTMASYLGVAPRARKRVRSPVIAAISPVNAVTSVVICPIVEGLLLDPSPDEGGQTVGGAVPVADGGAVPTVGDAVPVADGGAVPTVGGAVPTVDGATAAKTRKNIADKTINPTPKTISRRPRRRRDCRGSAD
jgi:hypothetical protein